QLSTTVRIPRETPIAIGETSRPPWLSFQSLDTASVQGNEKLGAAMANVHLNTSYRAVDGTPSYALAYVAFALGPNWAFPVHFDLDGDGPAAGARTWITTSSGIAGHWLTPMHPFAAQLILDGTLDPDGDWDNDGGPNLTFGKNPFTGKRAVRRGLNDFLYKVVPRAGVGSIKQRASLDEITWTRDNCPYTANADQSDIDGD